MGNTDPLNHMLRVAVLACICALSSVFSAEPGGEAELVGAVVKIVSNSQRGSWYSPWQSQGTRRGTGTGFVISGGRILTNAHVVSDAKHLLLFFHNDPEPYPARVVATGHDCDLALIEPEELERVRRVKPLEFGELPEIRSTVHTYGYPAGGQRFSITAGVVSRIEMQGYSHSSIDQHLTIQTDAAINPGNSGGPVLQEGKVIGVAFQAHLGLENVGMIIPTDVVDHFLSDLEDGRYDGYPDLGARTVNMENSAARARTGMRETDSGVRVDHVHAGSSADGHLEEGDIILDVEGQDVANDGTISWHGLRFDYGVLVDRLLKGDELQLTILRNGTRKALRIPLGDRVAGSHMGNIYDRLPYYYIYGGFVFVPLSRETLKTFGGHWQSNANAELLYEFFYRPVETDVDVDEQRILLLRRLDHPVNADLPDFRNRIVKQVNGRAIGCLGDLVQAIESGTGPRHTIEFEYDNSFLVLDRSACDKAHDDILRQYGIAKDRRL